MRKANWSNSPSVYGYPLDGRRQVMRPISRRRFIRTGGAAVAFAKPAQSSTAIDHPAPGEDCGAVMF
jgi:hypothetical protein